MTTSEIYLLPVFNPDHATLEPVDFLLEALNHIAATPCTAAKDADERRELLYLTAAENFANTYPAEQQDAVYERHVTRYAQLNPTQQRIATLALHGVASDRATGTKGRDGHTWAAAAIAALELYRANRATTRISERAAA